MDIAERNRLIVADIPLIRHAVTGLYWKFPYLRRSFEIDDLVQEGVLPYMAAIRSYNPTCGPPFPVWAVLTIRRHIRKYAMRHQLIRLAEGAPVCRAKALRPLPRKERQVRVYDREYRDFGELYAAWFCLPEEHRSLLDLRFGLTGEPHPLQAFGNSRQRGHQKVKESLERIRELIA